MRKTTYITAIALASLGLLATGCGGDDDDGSAAGGTTAASEGAQGAQGGEAGTNGNGDAGKSDAGLSKAFLARADAACVRAVQRGRAYLSNAVGRRESAPRATQESIDAAIIPALRTAASELEGLAGSPEEEADANRLARALRRDLEAVEGDRSSIESHLELGDYFRRSSALARELGLRGCIYAE